MPVQRYVQATPTSRAMQIFPSSLEAVAGWEGRCGGASPVPAPGRERVVRARLHNLFASLGELPGFPDLTAPERDEALAGLLDDICPAGTVAVLGRQLPDRRLALEDLLVSSRGVVLVGPGPSHAVSG